MNSSADKKSPFLYVIITCLVAAIFFAILGGAAHTAVKAARFSAAKASIGHVEAVLLLAEVKAQQDGLGPPPETYPNVIKSYGDGTNAALTMYENYILEAMLTAFGPLRDFDFAVSRYQDGAQIYTQVYYFPNIGQTDTKRHLYYLLKNNVVTENSP